MQILRLADGEQNPIGNNINLPDNLINECLGVECLSHFAKTEEWKEEGRFPKASLCIYIA